MVLTSTCTHYRVTGGELRFFSKKTKNSQSQNSIKLKCFVRVKPEPIADCFLFCVIRFETVKADDNLSNVHESTSPSKSSRGEFES